MQRRRLGRLENRPPPSNKSDMMDAPIVHEFPVLDRPLLISTKVQSISLDIRERMVAMGIAESINDRQPAQYCHPRAWFPASLWNEIRQSAFADWRGAVPSLWAGAVRLLRST